MNLPFLNVIRKTPKGNSYIKALWKLQKIMLSTLDFQELAKNSVNGILTELGYLNLGYKIIVLALINEQTGTLDRIAISETEEARKALQITPVPFHEITIPLTEDKNVSIAAIKTGQMQITDNWYNLLRPVYKPEEAVKVQEIVGIKVSVVYPLISQGKPIGVLIFSMKKDYSQVSEEEKDVLEGFKDLVALAVQRSIFFNSLHKTSQDLQEANSKLQQLDKLKDDFVSVASHELRTPMTAIRSYVWMALHKSDIPLSQKLERYLYRTLVSTERLINLVNDMLNVSRIESGRIEITPKAFDIVALVKEVIEEVKAKSDEKRLQLVVMEHRLPQVFADADKVHQILLNLIGNSLKFTYPGGSITTDFFTDGKMVEISIKDNGSGIAPDDLNKLFHKFARLDNSYVSISTSGGTGLGLYISKTLIELMHGKIWVKSDGVDKGSTFCFSLPIASEEILKHASDFIVKAEGEAKALESVAL